jgi:hypothetical protein
MATYYPQNDREERIAEDMERAARPVAHIRAGVVKADRRIMGSRGSAGHTLCGADLTAYDVTVAEARRAKSAELARWVPCAECRRKVEGVR